MKNKLYLLAFIVFILSACKRDRNESIHAVNVTSFWPNSGNAGTIVTFQGQGLNKNTLVSFNGAEARVIDARDTILIVMAPQNGSSGALVVKEGERKIEVGNYTYQALSMHRVAPLNGPAGTNVSIYGAGFGSLNSPATVTINGKSALVTSMTDTLLVATIPEDAGTGKLIVAVDGKSVDGPAFTFQKINTIKPVKGGAGTQVVIDGTGFETTLAANTVTFNGKAANIIAATANKLTVNVPEGVTTGPVALTINGQKTVGQVFTVVPKPQINTVAPLSAPANTRVEIAGANFSSLLDEVNVTFNGKAAKILGASDNRLSVEVPAGAGMGKMVIAVNGQQSDGPLFKEQALGISQLIPDNGLAGSEVVVKGMGFDNNIASNQVTFNGIAATVTAVTDSTLNVVVPANISTGLLKVTTGQLVADGPEFRRAGVITIVGGPQLNVFADPKAVVGDSKGNYFVADINVIKKVDATGNVSIFAGRADNSIGYADGQGTAAAFSYCTNMVIDAQDNLYISDGNNRAIRKVTPTGMVSTVAKVSYYMTGLAIDKNNGLYFGAQYGGAYRVDAAGNSSQMGVGYYTPTGTMAIDNKGVLYFAGDFENPYISKIADNVKSLYAGNLYGFANGSLTTAGFSNLSGLVYNNTTNEMFVADNSAIRYIYDGQVTRITGWSGGASPAFGYADGTLNKALFNSINAISIDRDGNILVVERYNKAIRKIILR
ncbi:DUF5008 domain-containing protein [Chitinophaga silvatica]|uniref:DUF5008 domain-containing protein n=1 Tax=Chitinophaga silvatica TaxID=2282649 RepID=A0A3E1YHF6_9BACT|nr:IPT/TIG domain-containing protein [Chitinophaga silvatica]RFS26660.1 DUF5008 domain-containing protein [Chitinophaga silvatica]